MDKRQENSSVFPISPSSSAAPTPGSTQPPTSFKKDLLDLKVPSAEIDRLISLHNRHAIPIVEDEEFCKQLCQVVVAGGHIDELGRQIRAKRFVANQKCASARIEITLSGLDFFHTDEQRLNLIAGLQGPTIHGYERLVDIVSFFFKQMPRSKSNTKHRKTPPRQASTMGNGVRRSKRIELQNAQRSTRKAATM